MNLMLDSADLTAWRDLIPTGMFSAITTNPVLMQRAGRRYNLDSFEDMLATATELGVEELQLQTVGERTSAMVEFGRKLGALDPNRVVVKVPLTPEGIRAAAVLRREGQRVTMTACYAAKQMLVASALEADYIAPYYGRLLESGQDADGILDAMLAMPVSNTRVLVASLRSAEQVVSLAARGFDSFTMAPAVAEQLLSCEASLQATADFEAAAKATR